MKEIMMGKNNDLEDRAWWGLHCYLLPLLPPATRGRLKGWGDYPGTRVGVTTLWARRTSIESKRIILKP